MKLLLRLFFILFPFYTMAQAGATNAGVVNKKNTKIFELTPDSLARYLTSDYTTNREKVTSIFRWITENISYNVRAYYGLSRNTFNATDDDEDTGALKPLSERVAIDVLRKRVAFCDGYARLFKTLCDYSGIRSEIITGYAATNIGRRKFGSNHRWNAVYLDSSWYLLDATWASGHLTFSTDEFIQNYNNYYFLTPPKDFARDHYPEELQWTLLSQPPYMSEFRSSPFKTHAFLKNYIRSYKPESGVIEASAGDTLQFFVETKSDKNNFFVLDTAFVDSAVIASAVAADASKSNFTIAADKAFCKYIVGSSSVKWLTIILNDEAIMRYKLNIRKNFTAAN